MCNKKEAAEISQARTHLVDTGVVEGCSAGPEVTLTVRRPVWELCSDQAENSD